MAQLSKRGLRLLEEAVELHQSLGLVISAIRWDEADSPMLGGTEENVVAGIGRIQLRCKRILDIMYESKEKEAQPI